ncbi:MAG: hypothetical protein IJ593_04810, partial [Lachnospiraceae bacterium]|nr:hypothetical protein [Lachnospiraceae bacterium]
MDHYDAAGNGIGGGEILDVVEYFRNLKSSLPFMDNSLIMQYKLMPLILLTIIVLIVAVLIRIIMRIFNINRLNKGKGIMNELSYAERLRKHDESILRWNAIISSSTRLVEKSIFKTNKKDNEYTAYNLERAGIKTPGGYRTISPEEWNAVIVVIASSLVAIGLVITIFANYMIGALFILITIVFASIFPMMYLRNLV